MVRNETNSEIIREIGDLIVKGKGIYTHSGNMHADDVYAVAAAILLYNPTDPLSEESIKLIHRVNDNQLIEAGLNDDNALILDIGKGRFDHHFKDQPEKKEFYDDIFYTEYHQENFDMGWPENHQIEKSAVARLWSYAGPEIVYQVVLSKGDTEPVSAACCEAAAKIEKCLISQISDTDTRGQIASPNLLAAKISHVNDYITVTNLDMDAVFASEVKQAIGNLMVYCVTEYADAMLKNVCLEEAAKAEKEGHPLWVECDYIKPSKFAEVKTPVLFEVCESNRTPGEWNLLAVDTANAPIIVGKISDIPGYLKNPVPFLAIFDSAEAAEKAAEELTKDL